MGFVWGGSSPSRRAIVMAVTAAFVLATLAWLPVEPAAPERAVVTVGPLAAAPEPAPVAGPPIAPSVTAPDDVSGPAPATTPETTVPAPPPPAPASAAVKAVFLGDSVASTMALGLRSAGPVHGVQVVDAGIWGCGVVRGTPFRYFGSLYTTLPNDCDHWNDQWQRTVDRELPQVAVIVVGRWELMDRVFQGRWTHVGDPAFDEYLVAELTTAIAVAGSRGAKVALCTTPYYRRGDAPGGATWPEDEPARVDQVNALLRRAAAAVPGSATVVDLGARLSPEGRLAMSIDGVRIRTDGVHMAPEAGAWLAPWLLPQLTALTKA